MCQLVKSGGCSPIDGIALLRDAYCVAAYFGYHGDCHRPAFGACVRSFDAYGGNGRQEHIEDVDQQRAHIALAGKAIARPPGTTRRVR